MMAAPTSCTSSGATAARVSSTTPTDPRCAESRTGAARTAATPVQALMLPVNRCASLFIPGVRPPRCRTLPRG